MESLLNHDDSEVDKSDPVNFPEGRSQDSDIVTGVKGTRLVRSVVMNVQYAMYYLMYQAGIRPDQSPENVNSSQFFDSLMLVNGNIGEVITIVGDPLKHARLLELNGQTINLTDNKYRFLKEWFDQNNNKYKNFSIDIKNINTQDPLIDRWKFKTDIDNPNNLILPQPYANDTLKMIVNDDDIGLSNNGDNLKHSHSVNDHDHLNPTHNHTVDDHDHLVDSTQVGGSHTHDKGDLRIQGTLGDVLMDNNQETVKNIFSTKDVRTYQFDYDDKNFITKQITIDTNLNSGSGFTGKTGAAIMNVGNIKIELKKNLKTKNKQPFKTGVKTKLSTQDQGIDQNIASGGFIKYFIRY